MDPLQRRNRRAAALFVVLLAFLATTLVPAPTAEAQTWTDPLPYPEHPVAVYQLMWPNSPTTKLSTMPANVNVINLAFGQGDPPRLVGWGPQGKDSFLADAVAR